MQLIMKIAEEKRMNSAGMKALFNYIARESGVYKTIGIGMSDDSEKAFKQVMNNKRRFNKAKENENRFCYHEIISLEYGTDPELALKIATDYCTNLHQKKGFNCYMGVHIDKQNTHIHILVDSVNYRTGKMLQSLTEKQLEKVPERKELEEVYIYEEQRKIAEDMAIKNGYKIEDSKRYEAMHEAKKNDKNARKWLTKNQYKVFKESEEKSWRNEIANKVKEMYKRLDLTEENVNQIAMEYGLTITRHNKEKQTITFATVENGEATKNRIKLEKIHEQEKANFTSETNPFDYNNFFRDRSKEIENNREFEEFVKEIEAEELEKELEKIMKEKEKTIKEVAENLIKNKENIYIKEQEKATEISKMIESNQLDYKQDEKKIINLEEELIKRKEEIPTLEASIKDYTNTKTLLEKDLPSKEEAVINKTKIADDKEKEVERLKALLQQAEKELESANNQKELATSNRDNAKERIENLDTLIKSRENKINENNYKIISIPGTVKDLKNGLEVKERTIELQKENLKTVNENVRVKEQEYKEAKNTGLEKVLEYESYIKSLYEKKLEAEEEKKLEVAERYRKEIEEYQQNLIKQNIEWDRINKLNREIAEQVRLEREQKALAKKKQEAEARTKREFEEKIKMDLQNFIEIIDKGKIKGEDLIEMVDDLDECENWKDSHKLQYERNIKFYLSDLETTIKVKSAFRQTDELDKIMIENERLFKRITKYMDNVEKEKVKTNTKEVNKTIKEVEEVKKEDKGFEYE
ncbi:relaxase/mobilization nuclease domain-containing protein [Fusobacterium polymorphum]|uniref:relaxase/mobilization nuclease domain-containing protein n=1 Tax=Fusobacterium nucleatum subsp. polymorphum TaxID=76857 RepID=UPI00300ADE4C